MKKLPIFIGYGIILALLLFWYYRAHPLTPRVEIRGHKFTVELAVTPEEKQLGLGFRPTLAENHGMLFVFDHPEQHSFWMKGMGFPIDIIWIRDQTIVDITKNAPVPTTGIFPMYTPKEPVNKVLEVNAGVTDTLGIQPGDIVKILK